MTTHVDKVGEWVKLDDGSFGAQIGVGGRGAEYVGKTATLKSKAGKFEVVRLTEVVIDYGNGDVVLFRVER